MSASDYARMHLINNLTMRGIDAGQPTLCRVIDCLSLISSHGRLARKRNDELRQISDTEAAARSSGNPPPSLRCSLGQEQHGLRPTMDAQLIPD